LKQVESAIEAQLLSQKKSAAMQAWITKTRGEFASTISYAKGFAPASTASTTTAASPTTTG
jgi:hypothetical protein